MTWAFLCGLFYGGLLYAAGRKEVHRRHVERTLRDLDAWRGWNDIHVSSTSGAPPADLSRVIYTGFEDG